MPDSPASPQTPVLRSVLQYFGIVFATGFALGIARTLWLVPAFGERTAELLEMPVMIAASVLAARWVLRRHPEPRLGRRLAIGGIALGLLVLAELAVVFWVRKQTFGQYLEHRDPIAGAAYLVALAIFALAPASVSAPPRRP